MFGRASDAATPLISFFDFLAGGDEDGVDCTDDDGEIDCGCG